MSDYRCSNCQKRGLSCDHHVEITHLGNLGRITFAGRATNAQKLFQMVDVVNRSADEAYRTRVGHR